MQASTHLLGETLEVLKYHAYFAELRAEPRYEALLRKMKLAQQPSLTSR